VVPPPVKPEPAVTPVISPTLIEPPRDTPEPLIVIAELSKAEFGIEESLALGRVPVEIVEALFNVTFAVSLASANVPADIVLALFKLTFAVSLASASVPADIVLALFKLTFAVSLASANVPADIVEALFNVTFAVNLASSSVPEETFDAFKFVKLAPLEVGNVAGNLASGSVPLAKFDAFKAVRVAPDPSKEVAVTLAVTETFASSSITNDRSAGSVQITSFVPAEKLTAEPPLEEEMIVSRERVSVAASVTVPMPTSHSSASLLEIE